MKQTDYPSPLLPELPAKPGARLDWGRLYGSSFGLAIHAAATRHGAPAMAIVPDTPTALRLEQELQFFNHGAEQPLPVLSFPDWETLPYDIFSPHQEIISQRLATLYRLPELGNGILIVPVSTLMQQLPPQHYLDAHALMLDTGQRLDLEGLRQRLENSGYNCVSQVMEHGEFAVRGSLIDLFPMGSRQPYRIDLFDDEIESIRTFDPETQRTLEKVEKAHLLPAREFPLTPEAIKQFRQAYRDQIEGEL
ncbi:MAG TPA: transcription-repair coupling factor, partial [Gammaproteobacteria bacterium]|nr:transcription-repair coupling factor [Gammaproteobacteria bacterium]